MTSTAPPTSPGLRPTLRIEIADVTQVAAARRSAVELARGLGFDEDDVGRAAAVTTEAAAHVLKHAGRGEVLLSVRDRPAAGVEVIAIDRGPGFHAATAEDPSTTDDAGQSLGAMRRLSNDFQVHSSLLRGAVLRAFVCASGSPSGEVGAADAVEFGVVALPHPGESVCGDGWLCHLDGTQAWFIVADGLGHGPQAHAAAAMAATVPARLPASAEQWLGHAHAAMRSTRGAAVAVAHVDLSNGVLQFSGVGNISALVGGRQGNKHLVSMAGILGHNVRKLRQFDQAWSTQELLVMHSDGLATHWSLLDDPELVDQHPSIVAAVLYRDHSRGRDDITVLVARRTAG